MSASESAMAASLRRMCGHDSRSVDGCIYCEAADMLEVRGAGVAGLIDQVSEMKQRACRAHALCNALRIAHPEIAELGDDGVLHDAIHDILRVETPLARDGGAK